MKKHPKTKLYSKKISLLVPLLILVLVSACSPSALVADVSPGSLTNTTGVQEEAGEITTDPNEDSAEVSNTAADGDHVTEDVSGDSEFNVVLLPKFMGIEVFDQANEGAIEAARNLRQPMPAFVGPTAENSVAGQIKIVQEAVKNGYDAVMISNNAGDQISEAAQEAMDAGVTIVTWDSPIPSAEGESVFVAQVDFDETGTVMAEMAYDILDGAGEFAVLSANQDAANQNAWILSMEEVLANDPKYAELQLLDTVYGDDQHDVSYDQALALVKQYPDIKLIMSPTTVGIAAAAQAMQDEGLCEQIKVSGLGLPAEMIGYMEDNCVPEFALWSFSDLGYLTYHLTYQLAAGNIDAVEGTTFTAGRMGRFTIEKDPTRDEGLRVLMGSFTIYRAKDLFWE